MGPFGPAFLGYRMRLPLIVAGSLIVVVAASGAAVAAPRSCRKRGSISSRSASAPCWSTTATSATPATRPRPRATCCSIRATACARGAIRARSIVAGHADDSLLIEAIRYEGLEMPPKGQLPDEVIDDFVDWIEMGAPDPRVGKAAKPRNKIDLAEARKYWAFQPPKLAAPAEVNDTPGRSPTSTASCAPRRRRSISSRSPMPIALTLIRRVTFDLTGLPPTPEEIDAFREGPIAAGACRRSSIGCWLRRSSASAGAGTGSTWCAMPNRSGKERNIPYRYAWRYRDYVIDAFNADKPYDRFIVEQMAGDLLPANNAAEHDKRLLDRHRLSGDRSQGGEHQRSPNSSAWT